jgi:hypothetical protein
MFAGTPLADQYDEIVKAAQANNVPPSLVAAVMAEETGKGRSSMLRDKLNPAGIFRGGHYVSYPSVQAGIDDAAKVIAKDWVAGGRTIAGLGKIYAPPGASNDPNRTNAQWPSGVTSFQRQLAAAASMPGAASMEGDFTPRGIAGGRFNVPAGSGFSGQHETITLANGQRVTVNAQAAGQFKGFFNDLIAAGAPVHGLGGYGLRPGNASQHPAGLAIDWAQSGRDRVSPDVANWIRSNPEILRALEVKWGMSGGETWRSRDTGHFSIDTLFGSRHLQSLAPAEDRRITSGPTRHKVEGSANLKVDLNGFPRGTRTATSADGMFKAVKVNRGPSLGLASEYS